MEMKEGEWNEVQTPKSERMLNVFNPHLSTPIEKAVV